MNEIEKARAAWGRAASFTADKEGAYPEHADAQEFEAAERKVVLEYGCGGGSDALSYLRRGAQVIACDIVESNVATALARISDAGFTARGVVLKKSEEIPVPTGSVEIVNAHGVLHHIIDPLPVLRDMRRALKSRGQLFAMLYTETLEESFKHKIEQLQLEYPGLARSEALAWCTDGEGAPYARSYTEAQGRELLDQAGFSVVSTTEYNRGAFRTFKAKRK